MIPAHREADGGGRANGDALLPRSAFVCLEECSAHLAAGLEAPMLRSHAAAMERFSQRKSRGARGRDELLEEYRRTKDRVARLLGVDASWVGFSYNAAHFMNLVADSFAIRPGDNVVLIEGEFPSVIYPWLQQRSRGLEVVVAGSGQNPEEDLANVAKSVRANTTALVLSHSSYLTGVRRDLSGFRALADSIGAALVVDASHTVGSLEVDGRDADFLVSACYKWVLGVHGVALSMWNQERQPDWRPTDVGWASVLPQDPYTRGRTPYGLASDGRVFELGNPSFLGIHVVSNALAEIERFGIAAIEAHNLALGGRLIARLRDLPITLLTPTNEVDRAANTAFGIQDEQAWQQALDRAGVLAAVGQGRARFSTHLYNSAADVDLAADVIEATLNGGVR